MKALEVARADKLIGKSLDAEVVIYVKEGSDEQKLFESFGKELSDLFICSGAVISTEAPCEDAFTDTISGIAVKVRLATGEKCDRCWYIRKDAGEDGEGGHICSRCANILSVDFPEI